MRIACASLPVLVLPIFFHASTHTYASFMHQLIARDPATVLMVMVCVACLGNMDELRRFTATALQEHLSEPAQVEGWLVMCDALQRWAEGQRDAQLLENMAQYVDAVQTCRDLLQEDVD